MHLDQGLQTVNDICDVDPATLKQIYDKAARLIFSEQNRYGRLLGDRTAMLVKDKFNGIINEKGHQYLDQYSVVLPLVDIADFDAVETQLLAHFLSKMDFYYSEACHQLDAAKRSCQATNHGTVYLDADYQNAMRGWKAHIKRIVAKSKTYRMNTQPSIIYNFNGANARVNNNSLDVSTNVVNLSEDQLFSDLRKALNAVSDEASRNRLVEETKALEAQKDRPSRSSAYFKFIERAANHVTLFAPLIPALTQWVQQ